MLRQLPPSSVVSFSIDLSLFCTSLGGVFRLTSRNLTIYATGNKNYIIDIVLTLFSFGMRITDQPHTGHTSSLPSHVLSKCTWSMCMFLM